MEEDNTTTTTPTAIVLEMIPDLGGKVEQLLAATRVLGVHFICLLKMFSLQDIVGIISILARHTNTETNYK